MALKDDLIQKALRRSKPSPKPNIASKYNHFKIYEVPPADDIAILDEKPDTNLIQTEHITGHKPNTQPDTNLTQTEHYKNNVFSNLTQTEHATGHKVEHKPDTNKAQTKHKAAIEIQNFSFSSYVGLQRDILILFYFDCKTSRSRETQEISLQHVADSLNIRIGSVKTSIRRLEEKQAIKRIKFKNGRSGWSKYELQEHVYREIMQYETAHKLDTNRLQTRHKLNTQPNTEPDTSAVSSSSLIISNNTTTTSNIIAETKLGSEWQSIDIKPLANFGFTQTHLSQIAQQQKLSAEVVQNSIYAFAFDLKHNDKAKNLKTNPVNYFMGILRNGQPYAPPSNYESPEEEALRLYVERQRELEQRRIELENAAIELAFKEWLATLSEEDKNHILPHFVRNLKAEQPKLTELKNHFMKEIWVNKRVNIMQMIT